MEEDWSLQAIVGGCSHDQYTRNSVVDYNYDHDDLFYNFPDFQELENYDFLYKPFYDPIIHSFSPQLDSSVKFEQEDDMKVLDQKKESAKPKAVTPAAKYKRKKQQKRVVVQVTAEGLSSDLWAWRKYGQKPIKGSPYPRSYYRCSSSKGCLARKHVEESCSDPGMFIITYSAEHNHSQPTRRSSLAGTTRQKFSGLKRTSSGESSCVSSTTKEHSNFDEVQALKKIKHDEQFLGEDMSGTDDHEFVIPDSILTDDFFVVLNDLDKLISNSSSFYTCSQ